MNKKNTENILGYEISTLEKHDCIQKIYKWIKSGQKNKYFVCANPHSIEIAEHDEDFKTAIKSADLITPDGSGMVIASKILDGKIRSRVTGSGVFRELSKKLNEEEQYSYFFLGSTQENLEKIEKKMSVDYPDIKIAGIYSPPFKSEFSKKNTDDMIQRINSVKPDVLWVGMTAPKQEKWVYQNKNRLDVGFIGPVGAVFDFYVGTVQRSHPFFLKHGLEWLPRLVQQPKRLWKRMGVSAPKFVMRLLNQKIRTLNHKNMS
jgi:N-acetylglucosaminyldiphosphoundecaprenol N-acetyl-beta-D-mannosaminyltransferase